MTCLITTDDKVVPFDSHDVYRARMGLDKAEQRKNEVLKMFLKQAHLLG